MVPNSSQTDPIVEILRLAYRRGLAIQQEKAQNQTMNASLPPVVELVDQRQPSIEEPKSNVPLTSE
jgi:hypothetical protein